MPSGRARSTAWRGPRSPAGSCPARQGGFGRGRSARSRRPAERERERGTERGGGLGGEKGDARGCGDSPHAGGAGGQQGGREGRPGGRHGGRGGARAAERAAERAAGRPGGAGRPGEAAGPGGPHLDDLARGLALDLPIGRARRGHVHEQAAEGPDVDGARLLLAARHLGRHVGRRARDTLRVERERVRSRAEVGDLGDPRVREEHVARLEVAVVQVVEVQVGDALGDVARDREQRRAPRAELLVLGAMQHLEQRRLHQLEDNASVRIEIRCDAEHEHDVGVAQRHHHVVLLQQVFAELQRGLAVVAQLLDRARRRLRRASERASERRWEEAGEWERAGEGGGEGGREGGRRWEKVGEGGGSRHLERASEHRAERARADLVRELEVRPRDELDVARARCRLHHRTHGRRAATAARCRRTVGGERRRVGRRTVRSVRAEVHVHAHVRRAERELLLVHVVLVLVDVVRGAGGGCRGHRTHVEAAHLATAARAAPAGAKRPAARARVDALAAAGGARAALGRLLALLQPE